MKERKGRPNFAETPDMPPARTEDHRRDIDKDFSRKHPDKCVAPNLPFSVLSFSLKIARKEALSL